MIAAASTASSNASTPAPDKLAATATHASPTPRAIVPSRILDGDLVEDDVPAVR
jgi:hypothetical protein